METFRQTKIKYLGNRLKIDFNIKAKAEGEIFYKKLEICLKMY